MNQQPITQQPKPAVSKWLWIILIAVTVIGAGFFGWYYLLENPKREISNSKTTEDISDWKTVEKPEFGVSYKLPPRSSTLIVGTQGVSIKKVDATIEDLKNQMETDHVSVSYDYKLEKYSLNGRTVYISNVLQGIEGGVQEAIIDAPKGTLRLTFEGTDVGNSKTILSTFEFIK